MDYEKIIKYISGEIADEGEKAEVRDWVNLNKTNQQLFAQLKNVYAMSRKSNRSTDVENEYLKLLTKTHIRTFKYVREFFKYAAIVVLAVGITWFVQEQCFNSPLPEVGQINEVICPAGQITEIVLSDGTRVWLNSESKISYPSAFNAQNRSVQLDGEAFFEVTKNAGTPFFVKTQKIDIKVLGTSFNVDAFGENQFIETTLVEGKVELKNKSGSTITEMVPGQMARYDINANGILLSNVDTRFYSSWKEGKMTFFNEPLEVIITKLERWYNVKFSFDSEEIKAYRFSGTILKYKPLDQVLQIIKLSSPIDYRMVVNSEDRNEIFLTKLK